MEEQETPEIPATTSSPLPLKTQKRPFLIALGLLVILTGAVFAGIQIGKKQNPKTPSEILFNQPTVGVPTPAPDLTDEWRTYTNDRMKFSIKYPPDWFAHKETLYPIAEGRPNERYEAVFSFPVDNPSPQDFIDEQKAAINITYTPKPEGSFASYIDKLMSQDWGATPYQSEALVADIKATVIGIGNPPKNKYVIFDKNGRYFIGLNVEKNETYETYSQLFDQILSTFKFLESGSAETETQIAYLKNVYEKDGKRYVDVDYVEWFSGEEAVKAAMQDTGCPRETINYGSCAPSLNNGFYIRNLNPQIRTFTVVNSAKISLNFSLPPDEGVGLQDILWNQVKDGFSTGKINNYIVGVKDGLFELIISSNEEVVSLRQRYVP